MAQIPTWHSIRQRDRNVYHDDDQCPVGQDTEEKYRKSGHRCRQRCPTCARLRDPALQIIGLVAESMPL